MGHSARNGGKSEQSLWYMPSRGGHSSERDRQFIGARQVLGRGPRRLLGGSENLDLGPRRALQVEGIRMKALAVEEQHVQRHRGTKIASVLGALWEPVVGRAGCGVGLPGLGSQLHDTFVIFSKSRSLSKLPFCHSPHDDCNVWLAGWGLTE